MSSPKYLKPKASKAKHLPKYPLFSFQRTSLSGNYSFEFFGNDHRRQNQAYSDWIRHLHTWSSVTMTELGRMRKTEGFETLPLSRFVEPVQNLIKSPEYTKDTKLTVFRFNGGQSRMICLSDDNVFYVLAFDFNFSAYDHG